MRLNLLFASAAAALLLVARVQPVAAQDTEQFFKNNCAACHTIGKGRLTGPDLKDVTSRRDRAWLRQFIPDPLKAIQSGDPYALQLQKESYGLVMPSLPTLTPALVDGLLDYIDAQSGPEASGQGPEASGQPPAASVPFTAADVDAGRAIFSGRQRLSAGGPACVSCHTVKGVGGLGGGRLAPDLTLVYQRLGGRAGLTAWLGAPATPGMQSLFGKRALAPEEVTPLVAYFEASSQQAPSTSLTAGGLPGAASFALLGLGLAAVGLIVMDTAWKNRFRSVRRALVERATRS